VAARMARVRRSFMGVSMLRTNDEARMTKQGEGTRC
jgi:hypothetical protein